MNVSTYFGLSFFSATLQAKDTAIQDAVQPSKLAVSFSVRQRGDAAYESFFMPALLLNVKISQMSLLFLAKDDRLGG